MQWMLSIWSSGYGLNEIYYPLTFQYIGAISVSPEFTASTFTESAYSIQSMVSACAFCEPSLSKVKVQKTCNVCVIVIGY